MAVMTTDNRELHAAEEAYAAINRFDKVDYIKYIKVITYVIYIYLFIKIVSNNWNCIMFSEFTHCYRKTCRNGITGRRSIDGRRYTVTKQSD